MMTLIGQDGCENCKFAVTEGEQKFCRRMPPQAQILLAPGPRGPVPAGTLATWPPVQAGQWCGEHKRRILDA